MRPRTHGEAEADAIPLRYLVVREQASKRLSGSLFFGFEGI